LKGGRTKVQRIDFNSILAKTYGDGTLKTAQDLMLGHIAGSAEQSGALFADNGTLELPYLASMGLPPS
jgi:hypothetical protein